MQRLEVLLLELACLEKKPETSNRQKAKKQIRAKIFKIRKELGEKNKKKAGDKYFDIFGYYK